MLVAWLAAQAERQPVLAVWEASWADPTTLELLKLVIEQAPTVPMLHVLTSRPTFSPPWPAPLPPHLARAQSPGAPAGRGVDRPAVGGKALPTEVVQRIVTRRMGCRCYVEELTKMLLASALLRENQASMCDRAAAHGSDSRHLAGCAHGPPGSLAVAKEVAQLGAVLGEVHL